QVDIGHVASDIGPVCPGITCHKHLVAVYDIRGPPIVRIEHNTAHSSSASGQRGCRIERPSRGGTHEYLGSGADIQHIRIIHTTTPPSVGDRTRETIDGDAHPYLGDCVSLIQGFVRGVPTTNKQASRIDGIELDRSDKLRHEVGPATNHRKRWVHRGAYLSVVGIKSLSLK